MEIRVMSWNMAGAKMLEHSDPPPAAAAGSYTSSRLRQIDLILDNVVSAYQEAVEYKMPASVSGGKEDIWIIGGNFNASYAAEEIEHNQAHGLHRCSSRQANP